jgi:hypothetical protein
MRTRRNKIPRVIHRKPGASRLWLDRSSAIATGVTAALVLSTNEKSLMAHPDESMSVMISPSDARNSNAPPPTVSSLVESESDVFANPIRSLPGYSDEWTPELEKKFHKLAVKEAREELGSNELAELELLASLRRTIDNPRTGDEVLWEYKQRRLTRNLLVSLSKYVEFYQGPSPAWTSPAKAPNS